MFGGFVTMVGASAREPLGHHDIRVELSVGTLRSRLIVLFSVAKYAGSEVAIETSYGFLSASQTTLTPHDRRSIR